MSAFLPIVSNMKDKSAPDVLKMPWLMRICPACNLKGGLRKVIWGLPEDEPDLDNFVTGGCIPEKHNYLCANCGWKGMKIPK
jgi:hypothetical protein